GYWLSSDVRSREWGFMLDHSQSFQQLHPTLWKSVKSNNTGIIESDLGRTNYYTITPPAAIDSGSLMAWKFVVINTNHRMGLPFLHEHLAYLYPLLLAYLFSTVLLWMWARADTGKEIAEKELIALNRLLEKKVEKRTAELEATKDAAILSLATLAETRDNETGQHIFRTQHYVKVLAEALGDHPDFKDQLDERMIQRIFKSAPLHDIGKVGIPDEILLKHGDLDEHEQQVMRCHTTLGSDAIEEAINSISSRLSVNGAGTFLNCARDIAHYHHERWDGEGYPKGLSGDAIPLPARLMAVADVYDALVTDRVYKRAFTREETEHIILKMSPGQFDPRILKAFASVKDQFWEIKQRFAD
ncbi:HD-GYP domain-containing protein, partial [Neptuniibacter caesariensis]